MFGREGDNDWMTEPQYGNSSIISKELSHKVGSRAREPCAFQRISRCVCSLPATIDCLTARFRQHFSEFDTPNNRLSTPKHVRVSLHTLATLN